MPLISLQDVCLSYGQPPLIDQVNLSITGGERLCLIGCNGAGKSTLLKIISGQIVPDAGLVKRESGVKIAQLEQAIPQDIPGTVFDVIAQGLGAEGALAQQYHRLSQELSRNPDQQTMDDLERCQAELDLVDGWDINRRIAAIITAMELPADAYMSSLSGGYKRRALLARALICEPQLLLLDEPTNHLDIEAIQWLEQFLCKWQGALLFISHDRQFMDKLATRFVEIDRGCLLDFNCSYHTYVKRKHELLKSEERQNALFDKRLSQEETWIRQGIKARRTRNEGRVRALQAMRAEYAERRKRQGNARIRTQRAERSGKIVVEADAITFGFEGADAANQLVRDFSTLIQRGDKVGLIGRNGVGKTTLIKLLLGELRPQSGKIKTGTHLNIAYFDQHRSALDEQKSVQDNVSGGRDMLDIGGKSRHVISYLQDFLFTPNRCRQPVKALSGGERNRLLLARLLTQPANVLVLDEPTNDLDMDTLDLLEELLINYQGTVILVSHDRAFINNVVTRTLVFEDDNRINEYLGGYDDWLRQRKTPQSNRQKPQKPQLREKISLKKLSYKDQRELDSLPEKIENLESQISAISLRISQPDFYKGDRAETEKVEKQLAGFQAALNHCYQRWEALEQQS